ncbi:MAG TPA: type II TA system antitoxin MqsA family protein [Polyangiaceae bacterium]|nr:type II TA system antitoxin MqsA family protein [Polyangiaceae bacterium]
MKRCAECQSTELRQGKVEERIEVGGISFIADLPALICGECGENFVDGPDLERFDLAVASWLTSQGQRTPEAFRFARKAIGMRAADLAQLVGVTPETVSRWENGHGAIDVGVFALLGELVADRIEGKENTLRRLRALAGPVKAPKRAVRVELPKAG